ncbi:MAG: hypothetical protein HQK83_00155 [Fibrobacteria bacterium]|nr:hypothetical protein [Fibrobacteria bacterium]
MYRFVSVLLVGFLCSFSFASKPAEQTLEEKDLQSTSEDKGDFHKLKKIDVHPSIDNPYGHYTLVIPGEEISLLPLTRSFSDDILELQDREEIERRNDEH